MSKLHYVSIGNKCQTAKALNKLKYRQFALPFDFVSTLPHLIAKYIDNPKNFYPSLGQIRNSDGCFFGHFFKTNFTQTEYNETIHLFERRFKRLNELFNNPNNDIVLIYADLASVFNELEARTIDHVDSLNQLKTFLTNKFTKTNFKFLCYHPSKELCKYNNSTISHFNLNIPKECYLKRNLFGGRNRQKSYTPKVFKKILQEKLESTINGKKETKKKNT
tara:strand:+ start:176 stop:835 length:660 start_codon:yes stop_codon:yes gene_type:complete